MTAGLAGLCLLLATAPARGADPAPPAGAHPRLFMSAANIAGFAATAKKSGTVAAKMVSACQDTVAHPEWLTARGGADADTWPAAALNCAFSYSVTQNASHLTQALKYWNASLNDDQALGDGLGCVANASPNWQSWDGSSQPVPPVIVTVTHDTGYPMRWYAPYLALTYDWLFAAPGVDAGLRSHTRFCLKNWVDYYTQKGYHHDEVASNYNAGYVAGKTFTAIAIAGEEGADSDRIWTETIRDLFQGLIIGKGLTGTVAAVGAPAGVMLGSDWGEGWQYGALSALEYAISARALEENGVPLPELDAWTNGLVVRAIHGTVPGLDGWYVGGDAESDSIYPAPSASLFDAVLAGPSSDQAAAWAKLERQRPSTGASSFFGNALAELRAVTPADYRTQSPAPTPWYLARGTRNLYARTDWSDSAYWAVFTSAPQINSDHHHYDASNFVFSRGKDHLVVDPTGYGTRGTLPSNAVTADASVVTGTYAPSQTPWSEAELSWARGTESAVYAARSDFAKAFIFSNKPSDITYAHREWVFLPEGEIVAIDRVHTSAASRGMYVNFHTNAAGTLKLTGGIAVGTVAGSQIAIHPVVLSAGTPAISQPPVNGDCYDGTCNNARFAVDEYSVKVPGPWAVAVHVIDGLASGEAQATVASLNDAAYDPGQRNAGVVGAAVYRGGKQSYVVASSAQDGKAGAMLSYGVLGASPGRHVVFDAPEDAGGRSTVTAAAAAESCVVTITAGAGLAGHPLMFSVASAADGCAVTEDTNVAPGAPPPGGGVPAGSTGGGGSSGGTGGSRPGASGVTGGCGCAAAGRPPRALAPLALLVAAALVARRARRRRR